MVMIDLFRTGREACLTKGVVNGFGVKVVRRDEFAEILLAEFLIGEVTALFVEKLGADAWALGSGGFDTRPFGASLLPLVVEEALT
jgi:hypothetical protein